MRCRDVRHWLVEFAADGIDPVRAAEFHAHLAACPRCAREWREIEQVGRLLATVERPAPSEARMTGLSRRIRESVAADQPATVPWFRPAAAGALACLVVGVIIAVRPPEAPPETTVVATRAVPEPSPAPEPATEPEPVGPPVAAPPPPPLAPAPRRVPGPGGDDSVATPPRASRSTGREPVPPLARGPQGGRRRHLGLSGRSLVKPVRRRPASGDARHAAPAPRPRRVEPAPVPTEPPMRVAVATTGAGTALPPAGRAGHRERAVDDTHAASAEPAAVAFALRAPAEADCAVAEVLVAADRPSRGASPAAFRVEPAVVLSEEIPATMVARIPDR